MTKPIKIILLAAGSLIGLLALIAVALLLFVDANAYKPRLEAAASDALGMQVKVDGQLGIGFFPGLLLTLKDVHIRNRGTDLASATEARLGVDLIPLLQDEVRIRNISLVHPDISIEQDRNGKFNFEKLEATEAPLPTLDIADVSISDGTLRYTEKTTGDGFELGACSMDVHHLQLAGGKNAELMRQLAITAEIACGKFETRDFAATGLKFTLAGQGGVFDLKPLTLEVFDKQGAGNIHADYSGADPLYQFHYTLNQFRIGEFFKNLSPNTVAEGNADFSGNLTMRGNTVSAMKQSAAGDISLRGKNLTLKGTDLDEEFSRFESSQNFNLVDVGAFFFAGPVGLAVTKGYNFANILRQSGGSSQIRILVSDWKVEHGVAQAQDVALATSKNRVALQGGLDFVNEQFNDVSIVLIDAKGCAIVRQKIHGSFEKPVVEKPNVLISLVGPVLKLFKRGMALLPGKKCEVVYAGVVGAP